MSWPAFILILAIMGGSVICAHAQSVTTFEGRYNGVSATKSAGGYGCRIPPVPAPIFITGGVAQFARLSARPYQS